MDMTRRSILRAPLAIAAAQPSAAGRLKTRSSAEIAGSPISIGFEVLDRDNFDPERCYPHLAELGAKWARCQTGWFRTELRKGVYDFAWLDRVVDKMHSIGIQPWLSLGFGNPIYTPGAPHPSSVGWAPVFTPEAREGWTRFVAAIATHFRGRVRHWELWDEPNASGYWLPKQSNPDDYMEFVKLTVPVLRRTIPDVVVIGIALANIPLDFLERCLDGGLARYTDKIAYHPYSAQPEWNYVNDVRALRGLIARYDRHIPVWQGESGAPSSNYKSSAAMSELDWNEERQAKWLARRILTDLSLDIELVEYFHTVDFINYVRAEGRTGLNNNKGVLRGTDYTRKPSYYALQNLCTLFDNETRRADFSLRLERGPSREDELAVFTASFERRGRPIYAFWHPADLQQPFRPRSMRVAVWSGKAARLEEPILLDPLTGGWKPLNGSLRSGTYSFDGMSVLDYPQLITDRAVVI